MNLCINLKFGDWNTFGMEIPEALIPRAKEVGVYDALWPSDNPLAPQTGEQMAEFLAERIAHIAPDLDRGIGYQEPLVVKLVSLMQSCQRAKIATVHRLTRTPYTLPIEACPVCGVEWKRLSRLRLWPKDADVRVIIYDEESLKVEAAQCATCSYIFPLGALLDPDNDAFVKESRDRWQRGAWTGED